MSKKSFAKFAFFIFLFVIISNPSVFAQDESCGLKINVSRFDDESSISGATAIAQNTETKKIYKSALNKGQPFFAKLSMGEYKITLSKTGYKKSVADYVLYCAGTPNEVLTTSIPMWEGSSSEVVAVSDYIQTMSPDETTEELPESDSSGEAAQTPAENYKVAEGGVLNGKAANLVKPEYPAAARAVRASGAVNVQVTIDEQGNVISAVAVSGHPLLRAAAVKAARESKFPPTLLEGKPVKVTGIVIYNFVP
jgi:TonB family protein